MASTGNIGIGTTIEYETVGAAFPGTALAQVRSISGLAQEAEEVDITNNDTTGNTREFIAGLIDAGEASLELVFVKAELTTLYLIHRVQKDWKITLSDGSDLQFTGFVKTINWEIPVDDAIIVGVTIRAGGTATFTAAV